MVLSMVSSIEKADAAAVLMAMAVGRGSALGLHPTFELLASAGNTALARVV
jgi:hypothetical protein